MRHSIAATGFTVAALLVGGGCGASSDTPDLAKVKGKVNVNGQPGSDLEVIFEPKPTGTKKAENTGSSSIGRTDSQGQFELSYLGGEKKGAVVGTHTVRIRRIAGGGPAGGDTGAVVSDPIPAEYDVQSSITRDVKKGDNVFDDIEIKTK